MDLEFHPEDLGPAIVICSRRIFDRCTTIAEASSARVKALKRAPLNAAVRFLRQLADVQRIHNPMGRHQDFGLLRIRVDALGDKDQSYARESELVEYAKRIC